MGCWIRPHPLSPAVVESGRLDCTGDDWARNGDRGLLRARGLQRRIVTASSDAFTSAAGAVTPGLRPHPRWPSLPRYGPKRWCGPTFETTVFKSASNERSGADTTVRCRLGQLEPTSDCPDGVEHCREGGFDARVSGRIFAVDAELSRVLDDVCDHESRTEIICFAGCDQPRVWLDTDGLGVSAFDRVSSRHHVTT